MKRILLILAGVFLLAPAAGGAEPAPGLTILGQDYPRTFFFRASELGPSRKGMTYETWMADFSRLSGIMGKCLDEEIIGREASNPEWFSRFKHDNPRQVVLLHFNGNARDPRYAAEHYFAGHWVYRKATRITADVPAAADDTTIKVEDAADFRVNIGRFRTANDDIALVALGADGKHDWSHCEQVQLLEVDYKANTIRVKRGCYGTPPLAFKASQARAAAHQVEGPWGKACHLLWFYNYSTLCPKDPAGKTCADRLVDDLAGWLGKGGKLAALDGLEFDVMFNTTHGDTDGDGEVDDGIVGGVNQYGIGVVGFTRQLRGRLGPNRIIQADGALGPGGRDSQRAFGILNGIESEGWPNLDDWNMDDWSGGLNRFAFWQANAHGPAFNYINHKWVEPVAGKPGEIKNVDVPFSRHRLAFAAAQCTEAMICCCLQPPSAVRGRLDIWDEFVCGTAGKPGWLGKPQGEAIHLAAAAADCLGGIGAPAGEALAKRISGLAAARVVDGGVEVSPRADAGGGDLSFTIRDVPVSGENFVVYLTMKAAPRRGYPAEMGRIADVGIVGDVTSLMRRKPAQVGMAMRTGGERPLDSASGARVNYGASLAIGERAFPAYAIHPPFKGGVGYVFWCADVDVPPHAELRFQLGMGEMSPLRSDGVWFRVLVAPLSGAAVGEFSQIFEESTKAHEWLPRSVSLAKWAGQRVRLKFVGDCGPHDNAIADQGYWGDVKVLRADIPQDMLTPSKAYMTWANDRFFASVHYFRPLRCKTIDLSFRVEGCEPVTIQRLTAHAHADAMYRVFDNGLVLANPSLVPYTFDLTKFLPQRHYRRIQGTPAQDTQANNGQPVGPNVTLGPLDALFLPRENDTK